VLWPRQLSSTAKNNIQFKVDEEDDDGDEVKKEKQLERVLRESKTEKGVSRMPTGKVRRGTINPLLFQFKDL